jgi:hypothetical protein
MIFIKVVLKGLRIMDVGKGNGRIAAADEYAW